MQTSKRNYRQPASSAVAAIVLILVDSIIFLVIITDSTGNLLHIPLVVLDIYILALLFLICETTPVKMVTATLFAALSARVFSFLLCWQLPTYNGTKSYQNLLVGVYGMREGWNLLNVDPFIQNAPINLIRSGYYPWGSGNLDITEGAYWELNDYSDVYPYRLFFENMHFLSQQNADSKGNGMSLRCLIRWRGATPYLQWY